MGKLELIIETDCVSMYSPKYDGDSYSEFEKFLLANRSHSQPQLKTFFDAIISAVEKIGECGARENLFRPEGGNIKAVPLYISFPRINKSVGKMRLYCLRLSENILILGGGGVTTAQRYEDDAALLKIVNDLRGIEKKIKRIAEQAETDYEDCEALKRIIETIIL